MKEPKVSIIVPVYNTAPYLRQCIDSLCNQTLREIEILLIDDGSTDDSGDICDEYQKKDGRVQVIHKQNGGQGTARNQGIKQAQSEYIAFADSDDIVDLQAYGKLYEAALQWDAGVVLCGMTRMLENYRQRTGIDEIADEVYRGKENILRLLQGLTGQNPNNRDYFFLNASVCRGLYRKKEIESSGAEFPDLSMSEDLFFNLRVISRCETVVTFSQPLYFYRDHSDSVTTRWDSQRFETMRKVYLELLSADFGIPSKEQAARSGATFLGFVSVYVKQSVKASQHPFRKPTRQELQMLCNDSCVEKAMKDCRWGRLSFPLNLFCVLIRFRWVGVLTALVVLYSKGFDNK